MEYKGYKIETKSTPLRSGKKAWCTDIKSSYSSPDIQFSIKMVKIDIDRVLAIKQLVSEYNMFSLGHHNIFTLNKE